MKLLKTAGYNTIDVYFPGTIMKQLREYGISQETVMYMLFLELAKCMGFFVIARPGPYICSEWDGGGLPHGWLQTAFL